MAKASQSKLRAENDELRLRLEEAEQALEAIRTGQVESLVVEGPDGPRIFTLEGATQSYRLLVESMNEGAATLREDGTVLYCNGRFAALLDLPLQQVMGSALRDHVPADQHGAFAALLATARTSSAREELSLRDSKGQEIPTYFSVSSIVEGATPVLCLVATDLREQKRSAALAQAEQTARESEERLRLTLRYAAAGTWGWDIASGALTWSHETYLHYGLDPAGPPLSYADWERTLHPDDLAATLAAVTACLEGRAADFRAEFRVRNPQLGERWLLGVGRVERSADGIPARMLGLNIDITERKRAEEALRESEERLQLATQELRAEARRKDEFLGMLSHELRNPLAPIRNSIYILKRADPHGPQAERAKAVIERQVDHVTSLVDDLLDVTRIVRGKIELQRSRTDLTLLVRRAAEDHAALMLDRGIDFTWDLPAEALWTDGDPTRLAQVVANLLQNAAKFTMRGGRVVLGLELVRGAVEIHVRDTGIGIDAEILGHVFEPFVQAKRSLARTEGGLGLGLALVKGIAELHGGSVRAASAGPEQGSEIVVRLPLAEHPPPERAAHAPATTQSQGFRVLVVDDNADAAESLAAVVEMLGHVTDIAYDGPSAIAKARAHAPSVVLCDIGLPGMSGYEVAKRLRAENDSAMQIVAVSGYAQPEDVQRAVEAGFDRHLAKPVDMAEIERILGSRAGAAR